MHDYCGNIVIARSAIVSNILQLMRCDIHHLHFF